MSKTSKINRLSSESLCKELVNQLEQSKANDVVHFDIRGMSSMSNFIIIASGNVSRHVKALAEELRLLIKQRCGLTPSTEGLNHGDWVLIDASDIIIHIFRPEVREYYSIEGMWNDVRLKKEAGHKTDEHPTITIG